MQWGFFLGESTVNQLPYLYHIFTDALDAGKEVQAVTSAKVLIVNGMKDSFTNLKLLVFQKMSSCGSKATSQDAVSM